MAAQFAIIATFFVIDQCSGLTAEAELGLSLGNRAFKIFVTDISALGWVQTERKEILAALRPPADRMRFAKCTVEIIRQEAP